MGRIKYIDALRGFTMFLVVFGHVMSLGAGIHPEETSVSSFFITFRMPMFFFISGFIAYKAVDFFSTSNYWKRLRRKAFVQLVPTAILFSVYKLATGSTPIVFFTNGLGGYWFTLVLFEFFIIYFTVSLIGNKLKNNRFVDIVMVTLSLIIFCGYFYLLSRYENIPKFCTLLSLTNFCCYFQYFVFGMLCMKYKDKFYRFFANDKLYTIVAIIFITSFLALRLYITRDNSNRLVYYLFHEVIVRYAGLITVLGIFVKAADYFNADGKVSQIMQFVGRRTLDIYLIHYFLIPDISGLRQWVFSATHENVVLELLVFGVVTVSVIALILLISFCLRRSTILTKYLFGVWPK